MHDELLERYERILCMSNVRGKKVKTDKIDFSFYFSNNDKVSHWSRVKVVFNPEKLSHDNFDGYMELWGSFKWVPNRFISEKKVEQARKFFKKYSVLFDLVWVKLLQEDVLQDYFRGQTSWEDLLGEIELIDELFLKVQECKDLQELEEVIKEIIGEKP